ncbi:MAG: hypothetical protein DRQ42_04800 [Gammaproteobacteria bacterium]|nr:MAG: hypothetical protein DRQ42_04800 [Gammaproteobacteria bacterium]
MPYTFFDELGVEPLGFVSNPPDIKPYIPDSIHMLYSVDKLNVLTRYVCGRYINTEEENRFVNTAEMSRIVQTTKGNCV